MGRVDPASSGVEAPLHGRCSSLKTRYKHGGQSKRRKERKTNVWFTYAQFYFSIIRIQGIEVELSISVVVITFHGLQNMQLLSGTTINNCNKMSDSSVRTQNGRRPALTNTGWHNGQTSRDGYGHYLRVWLPAVSMRSLRYLYLPVVPWDSRI